MGELVAKVNVRVSFQGRKWNCVAILNFEFNFRTFLKSCHWLARDFNFVVKKCSYLRLTLTKRLF